MGIDVNDLKILINTGFRYLIKCCHQWAKDHPLVSGVLLFFYLLYIFFPNVFDILFYTFPLIICIAIILGGKHIKSKENQEHTKNNNKKYEVLRNMSIDHRQRRRHLSSQLSRVTLDKLEELPQEEDDDGDDKNNSTENFRMNKKSNEDDTGVNSKQRSRDISTGNYVRNDMGVKSEQTSPTGISARDDIGVKSEQTSRHTSTGISSHSDTDEDENGEDGPREATHKAIEWTEDDQRNLMELGSSEIERNKRLESLIAKRRARKLLSMQPRRAHYPYENLMDQVGSIMVSRCIDNDQPGSAPCAMRLKRNPFDLPYDPHEEKPILTGGSFDEEFFSNEQKEFLVEECLTKNNDNFIGERMEDPFANKSLPSFFAKPKSVEKPGVTRFRRESEENLREIMDELAKEDTRYDQAPNQQDSSDDQVPKQQDSSNDQAPKLQDSSEKVQMSNTSLTLRNEDQHELENPFAKDFGQSELELRSSSERMTNDDLKPKDENENNMFHMDSIDRQCEDDEDSTSSSSSSSSTEVTINAIKNEAFRNSVKKVLNCLIIQRNMANIIKENRNDNNATTSNGLPINSIPNVITTPTKMEERSFYTNRPHHTATFSIASDMQVEVSETGSPPLATLEPSSPTDQESLVYDGDVDKDANSGDEDLWGASPHPMKLGEFATNNKFKLPDIIEESNQIKGYNDSNDDNEQRKDIDQDQRSIDAEIVGSRSSASSSSDGLTSHMQAKTEHLAEYLANLPPTESGCNVLEETEPSLVSEPSAEDLTLEDEMHPILSEMDETKDESKETEEMGEYHPRSDETNETRETNETDSTAVEQTEGESTSQEMYIEELNNQPRTIEHESSLLDSDTIENIQHFNEPIIHEKEAIPDSLSTTCQEDIFEQSRLEETPEIKLEEDNNISNDDDEVRENSANDSISHDKSTTDEKGADEQTNHVDDQANHVNVEESKPELHDPSTKTETNLREVEDVPQPAIIAEDNLEPSNSTEAVSSSPTDDPVADTDHPKT